MAVPVDSSAIWISAGALALSHSDASAQAPLKK
jgi:hypothetical protein